MREIKFRGKDDYNQWIYGSMVHITETYEDEEGLQDCNIYQIITPEGAGIDVEENTIGQNTRTKR